MPTNPKDRYQVWVPGGNGAKGFHVGTYDKVAAARKAVGDCSHPEVRIWDNEARNVDGSKGREVR